MAEMCMRGDAYTIQIWNQPLTNRTPIESVRCLSESCFDRPELQPGVAYRALSAAGRINAKDPIRAKLGRRRHRLSLAAVSLPMVGLDTKFTAHSRRGQSSHSGNDSSSAPAPSCRIHATRRPGSGLDQRLRRWDVRDHGLPAIRSSRFPVRTRKEPSAAATPYTRPSTSILFVAIVSPLDRERTAALPSTPKK